MTVPLQGVGLAGRDPIGFSTAHRPRPTVRSKAMLLMYEELARARMRDAAGDATEWSRARRLLAARRWQRRAARSARRARVAESHVW